MGRAKQDKYGFKYRWFFCRGEPLWSPSRSCCTLGNHKSAPLHEKVDPNFMENERKRNSFSVNC
jgi:hypothetical protein